ncbi:hypothetical protein DMC30DRAFT_24774 [Rhodotorula diobovata]|uniref:Uncharacterized protein n=1 Tax=Rhodotorula diobovata TaxID=5288 RepID=A0A5C5FQ93_9BASI|nr:hypothetical protein DMC30DRAFT_24774 [Rhodotorula diobovata]
MRAPRGRGPRPSMPRRPTTVDIVVASACYASFSFLCRTGPDRRLDGRPQATVHFVARADGTYPPGSVGPSRRRRSHFAPACVRRPVLGGPNCMQKAVSCPVRRLSVTSLLPSQSIPGVGDAKVTRSRLRVRAVSVLRLWSCPHCHLDVLPSLKDEMGSAAWVLRPCRAREALPPLA